MPVYLGLNGMSIEVTNFYYTYLSQPNISNRLISLCVSDTLAIDNGLWLAEHVSTFINLRHLSLIDIKRSYFESILNSLLPINSLIIFSVRFSTDYHAVDTFIDVPEGAYYERIFYLFPSLRVCYLCFWRYIHYTVDSQFVLPIDRTFMPIQSSLLHLQSLALRCSPSFLSYLLEHLPQLEQLSYTLTDPWLPEQHPLRHSDNNQVAPINKRLASNLCRLKIEWFTSIIDLESVNKLFERDVLFSLTNFTLLARIADPYILQNLLSMLSNQCLYSFGVNWLMRSAVLSSLEINKILSDIYQQLKGPVPIELELSLEENMYQTYRIRAVTVPRMDKCLCVYFYLHKNTVHSVNLTPCDRRAPPETIETMNIVNILPSSIIINIDPKYTSTGQATYLHKTLFYVSAALHDAITGFPVYVNGHSRLAISQHNWNEMHVLYIEAPTANSLVPPQGGPQPPQGAQGGPQPPQGAQGGP
ncbi:unnamed protein product [Rotaria sp. Silwood1]|nr:unnamed protein product [Rotaria sp. Silwood1]